MLAPKRRREQVRIKGPAGELLGPKAEFEEIFAYYQKVFSRDVPFDLPQAPVDAVSEDAVLEAIGMLKGGKAVPPSSVPTEIWLLCPAEYAAFLTPRLNPGEDGTVSYPPEASNCTLALLPKPNKTSRRPADLRPLGLQDASSKS